MIKKTHRKKHIRTMLWVRQHKSPVWFDPKFIEMVWGEKDE